MKPTAGLINKADSGAPGGERGQDALGLIKRLIRNEITAEQDVLLELLGTAQGVKLICSYGGLIGGDGGFIQRLRKGVFNGVNGRSMSGVENI